MKPNPVQTVLRKCQGGSKPLTISHRKYTMFFLAVQLTFPFFGKGLQIAHSKTHSYFSRRITRLCLYKVSLEIRTFISLSAQIPVLTNPLWRFVNSSRKGPRGICTLLKRTGKSIEYECFNRVGQTQTFAY
jgi:hypothetical protein